MTGRGGNGGSPEGDRSFSRAATPPSGRVVPTPRCPVERSWPVLGRVGATERARRGLARLLHRSGRVAPFAQEKAVAKKVRCSDGVGRSSARYGAARVCVRQPGSSA